MFCTDLLAICDTDGPTENWKAIFDLNVLALSICTKEAIHCMHDGKVDDGHIVHINRYVTGNLTRPRAGFQCLISFIGLNQQKLTDML
jgi:hypothetical protein